jgi:hypothetical protein
LGQRRETTGNRGPPVGERKRDSGYRFGGGWNGPRAPFFVGPKGFPGVLLLFFDFFSPFLFSDFRFVSKSFANCLNSNQTNS